MIDEWLFNFVKRDCNRKDNQCYRCLLKTAGESENKYYFYTPGYSRLKCIHILDDNVRYKI